MKSTGQYCRPFAPSLPRFVWIALSVLTSITIGVVGVITAARGEMPDPFSDFRYLFGSEARQAALARGFTCQDIVFPNHSTQTLYSNCGQGNAGQMFSGIYLR